MDPVTFYPAGQVVLWLYLNVLNLKKSPYVEVLDFLKSRLGNVTGAREEDLEMTNQWNSFHSYFTETVLLWVPTYWYFVSDFSNYDTFMSCSQITINITVDQGDRSLSFFSALIDTYLLVHPWFISFGFFQFPWVMFPSFLKVQLHRNPLMVKETKVSNTFPS